MDKLSHKKNDKKKESYFLEKLKKWGSVMVFSCLD